MRFQREARAYTRQLTALLLGLAVCSNCVLLRAYSFSQSSLSADFPSFTPEITNPTRAVPVVGREERVLSEENVRNQKITTQVDQNFGKLPLSFEANRGQADSAVKFVSRGRGYGVFLTADETVLLLGKSAGSSKGKPESASPEPPRSVFSAVRIRLQNANPNPKIVGLDELPGRSNYFIGNDPKKWRTDISNFAKVKYENVYPGVDMVYYGNQSQLEYDFVVAPRADTKIIKLTFEGAEGQRIDDSGDLVLTLRGREVRSRKPLVYQEQRGRRKEIAGRYVLNGKKQVGFEIGAYDNSKQLIIDPVMMYSTYLGGLQVDYGLGIAVDTDGNAYVSGETLSADFPVVNAYQPVLAGSTSGGSYSTDAFVVKLNPAGTQLVYSTFLGGHSASLGFGSDEGKGIAVDSSGCAYITGNTASPNFPTMNPFRTTLGGAFVAKLSPAGNALVYSSHLSANGALRIAVDSSGIAYVVGYSQGVYEPVNAIQQTSGGGYDIVIAKVSTSGSSLLYYTYLGGDGDDRGSDIALDPDGNMYVTGSTTSTNLPVTNAFQSAFAGSGTCGLSPNLHPCSDAFVVKLNPAGSSLIYFTYLGGSSDDRGSGIRVDSAGHAFVSGETSSTSFPTTAGAYQTTFGGENAASGYFGDAFVTKLDTPGNVLIYSTYIVNEGIAEGHDYLSSRVCGSEFSEANMAWAMSQGGRAQSRTMNEHFM